MNTIALRFSDSFAPKKGALAEHELFIKEFGYVWWGKKGPRISQQVINKIMEEKPCKVLLIRGGTNEKYWATVEEIVDWCPQKKLVPAYYRNDIVFYGSFLKVTNIEKANDNILERCYICTTGNKLSDVINKAMASYYIVEVK